MIKGGYYIKARCIQDSEIAYAPPHVREIWDWFIKEANHKDGKFKRGEMMRSIRDIQEGLKWFIGYRKMMYKKYQCEMALNWLRKHDMITTTKTTRGMLVTICKYDTYQNPKNYESNTQTDTKTTMKQQGTDTINKKDKNEEEGKEEDLKPDLQSVKFTFEDKYKYFIELFNRVAKETSGIERAFRGDPKSKAQFKARLKEGYKSNDFAKAIKNLYSNSNHRDNGFIHATPELITRSAKFVMYFNAKY